MQLTEAQLQANIALVQWQHSAVKKNYPLVTIHSLLIDGNPKFQHLKQLVEHFNQETVPERIKLKQSFIERLFGMLSELTRIPIAEHQLEFLNKIYKWAVSEERRGEDDHSNTGKSRPGTASTRPRTRAMSAYSRPATGRPVSGINPTNPAKRQSEQMQVKMQMKKECATIDYDKLQPGDRQFYAGIRSLHTDLDPPRKRLKQYQRKKFYEDESDDEDVEVINVDKEIQKEIPITEELLIQQIEAGQEEGEQVEGEAEMGEQAGVNIDDIPLEGQADGGAQQPVEEEEKEVIDKLKPKIKVYNDPKGLNSYKKREYEDGHTIIRRQRNDLERKNQEDIELAKLESMWAQNKGRAKSEAKRRIESARVVTNRLGIIRQTEDLATLDRDRQNIIHLQNYNPVDVNVKQTRPVTAFTASSKRARQDLIKNAFITGKLAGHIQKYEPPTTQTISNNQLSFNSITRWGVVPKKKTFEQILREAEEKVVREAEQEVMGVKEILAKNKVGIGANRIARSITYDEKELPAEPFVGHITGMAMIKNPFIKPAKKKKKKKSKK